MYTVTFYSYKGGVGRTMALANVATLLAQKGKRVLVVDFDLEAPSLPNYGHLSNLNVERGLVDYISQYRETGIAPNSSEYIYRSDHGDSTIWLMPAGDASTIDYSRKLASIDWKTLYEKEKGYLLFEDLKQQWHTFEQYGFDYVLVDSRTGYTDVGGICTRQLPDLVVAMYLPTMQNILGLAPIIEEVRNDQSRRRRPVELVFCAANVPDLDDEQHILSDLLLTASDRLGYDRDALNLVHHYGSLHVLSHGIFAQDRPNSRLAKEYADLSRSIIAHNVEDAEGAKLALQRMLKEVKNEPRQKLKKTRDEIASKIDHIFSLHMRNRDIAVLVARIRAAIGDLEGNIAALSVAIDLGDNSARLRGVRARAFQAINMTDESIVDLRYILQHENSSGAEVTSALRMLERTDKDYDDAIGKLLERRDLGLPILNSIAEVAQRDRRHLKKFANQLMTTLATYDESAPELGHARHHLGLALIGCGRFAEAVVQFGDLNAESAAPTLAARFNRFVAMWGLSGEPDVGAADELNVLMPTRGAHADANFIQCQAVLDGVLGDLQKAMAKLDQANKVAQLQGGRVFSCSSYLYLDVADFIADNEDLRRRIYEDNQVVLNIFTETVDGRAG
ncbi:KGGVGR-motif variant AAA ATPase [Pikeienuella sp. HZG-20]|uniref:KGGVGR-motif variant AAA ATPase n=1 Tax=Paludibacillus litoralis TaxID=3133267 RepID=UPI0030EC83EA